MNNYKIFIGRPVWCLPIVNNISRKVLHVPKSLRETAGQLLDGGGQGYKRCSFKGNCDTNRSKSNTLYNSKCH